MADAGVLEELDSIRKYVRLTPESVQYPSSIGAADAFAAMGISNELNIERFRKNLKIKVIRKDDDSITFDLIGADASLANAFRRILISEIPTMAIEHVIMLQNTSIIQDEVLAHRLGLIPILADPRMFSYRKDDKPGVDNTVVMVLDVSCERIKGAPKDSNSADVCTKPIVYSKDLKWVPQGKQARIFKHNPIRPVHDDITVAKLRPGQQIQAELHIVKGIGADHAKFSPVATASYRLLPEITFPKPIVGAEAEELVKVCPKNVFDIEDLGGSGGRGGARKQAKVARPRDCSMCRECIRGDWADKVKLQRVRDHFIFDVESTGVYRAEELFELAADVLISKAQNVLAQLPEE